MARIHENTWKDYDIGDLRKADTDTLRAAVRRAAKAANQRLLRLERAGLTESFAYKSAIRDLKGKNRERFKERPKDFTRSQLLNEYGMLREFFNSKGSTVQGFKSTQWKRYQTAIDQGYEGTFEEFYKDIEDFFNKNSYELFDSKTVWEAVRTGTTYILDEILEESKSWKKDDRDTSRAKAIYKYNQAVKKMKERAAPQE